MENKVKEIVKIDECDLNFVKEVEKAGGKNVAACFQCGTCSGGCPASFVMDYTPRQIMRMVNLGMRQEVLSSSTIWLCASCQTCITRCPNEVELPEVMSVLKSIALREGIESKIKEGPILSRAKNYVFRRYGLCHETPLFIKFARECGGVRKLLKEVPLSITLLRKGKLDLFPRKIKAIDQFRDVFRDVLSENGESK